MSKTLGNYLKYLFPSMILSIGLAVLLIAAIITASVMIMPHKGKANNTTRNKTNYSNVVAQSSLKQQSTIKNAQNSQVQPLGQVQTTESQSKQITTTSNSCKVGKVTIDKSNIYAPSTVTFTVKDSKNVGYFHISYKDAYSESGHNSGSGPNIERLHSHLYSHQGEYQPVIYAYRSIDDFRAGQPCDFKNMTLNLLKIPENPQQKNGWQWPTEGKVISVVGMRHQPVTGVYRMHQGIDIQNKKGTRINAARNGKVVATNSACHSSASNCGGGYGNYVVLRHSNGLYSIYAHLSQVNARVGQGVNAGEKIGEMGNTGLTHTVHLHFGIGPTLWVNYNVKDPLKVLPKR